MLFVPVRTVSGLFSVTGVRSLTNTRTLKAWLPSQRVALVDENRLMVPEWYRFIQYVFETVLGGGSARLRARAWIETT